MDSAYNAELKIKICNLFLSSNIQPLFTCLPYNFQLIRIIPSSLALNFWSILFLCNLRYSNKIFNLHHFHPVQNASFAVSLLAHKSNFWRISTMVLTICKSLYVTGSCQIQFLTCISILPYVIYTFCYAICSFQTKSSTYTLLFFQHRGAYVTNSIFSCKSLKL